MSLVQFISDADELAREMRNLSDCAEQIQIYTTRVSGSEEQNPWNELVPHVGKLRLFLVHERTAPRGVLEALHGVSALRILEGEPSIAGRNVYFFRTGDVVQVILGAPDLAALVARPAIAATVVEGRADEEFACSVLEFFRQQLKRARVPRAEDLQALSNGEPSGLDDSGTEVPVASSRRTINAHRSGTPNGPVVPGGEPLGGNTGGIEHSDGGFLVAEFEEQRRLLWRSLVGEGALRRADAVPIAARGLRDGGHLSFKRLRVDGPIYAGILEVLEGCVDDSWFDKPSHGRIRAICGSAAEFPDWLWRTSLLRSMDDDWVDRDEAIHTAAQWAVENVGLQHMKLKSGGRVDSGLRSAINSCRRRGQVEADGRTLIRRLANWAEIENGATGSGFEESLSAGDIRGCLRVGCGYEGTARELEAHEDQTGHAVIDE